MKEIPPSINNIRNSEILGYLSGKSCHGDIIEPIDQILKRLNGVEWFCPDPENFAYCLWQSSNVVFAFGTGMHEIGVQLPPQQTKREKRPGAYVGRFDGNEWWSLAWDSSQLKKWANMVYDHANNS